MRKKNCLLATEDNTSQATDEIRKQILENSQMSSTNTSEQKSAAAHRANVSPSQSAMRGPHYGVPALMFARVPQPASRGGERSRRCVMATTAAGGIEDDGGGEESKDNELEGNSEGGTMTLYPGTL
ncbi:unnamed protein product [Heligmosomoides polygyrus]|uniref:Uncharacterized protein n=1 Tax=Heligmosomoides polygyrus TaxID=6339 RepID=A0A183FYG6_HELPZ|nr:unnamed protein product [Heligmosomoides polygyrus]